MTELANDTFLNKYGIEFPSPSSLAVIHAEPVSLIPNVGYTFSDEALHIIGELVAPSKRTAVEFNRQICTTKQQLHEQILFFLDGPYNMARHILAVRNAKREIAMISCVVADAPTFEAPPPVGLLTIDDVPTLAYLGLRSPFLGQLLPIADGPKDGQIWAYFLGKVEQVDVEASESAEAPKERETA
jgi:hypothetical protein